MGHMSLTTEHPYEGYFIDSVARQFSDIQVFGSVAKNLITESKFHCNYALNSIYYSRISSYLFFLSISVSNAAIGINEILEVISRYHYRI
jgi:hypothetical protein